jgi:hypothetical protein
MSQHASLPPQEPFNVQRFKPPPAAQEPAIGSSQFWMGMGNSVSLCGRRCSPKTAASPIAGLLLTVVVIVVVLVLRGYVCAQWFAAKYTRRNFKYMRAKQLWWPKWGGIWYFDIPSPNTTVFSVLWPPSIAMWGSLVPPYTPGGAIRSIYKYLSHLSIEKW